MDSHRLVLLSLPLILAGCSGDEGGKSSGSLTTNSASSAGNSGFGSGFGGGAEAGGERSAERILLTAEELAARGDVRAAVEEYRRALELTPDNVDARFALGCALVPLSQTVVLGSATRDFAVLDEAIGHLEQVVAARPEHAESRFWYGRVLDKRERKEEAIAEFQRAVELDPEHGGAYKRLGLAQAEGGNVEAAEAAFQRALELRPDDAGLRFQLGNLALENDPERARDLYREAIEVDPKLSSGYHGLSQALARLGDADGAAEARELHQRYQGYEQRLDALVQAADGNLDDPEAQFAAAKMYYALGRFEESFFYFRRALALDPANADTHYFCGLIMMSEGNNDVAQSHFEESLFYEPEKLGPQIELIRVCHATEDSARVDELAEALETTVGAGGNEARNAFAEALIEVGKIDQARGQLKQSLETDPNDEIAKLLMARASK